MNKSIYNDLHEEKKCQKCQICNSAVITFKEVDQVKYYFFCKKCIKNKQICSKTKSQKLFLLDDSDFTNLKLIYIDNPRIDYKFYLYDDIEQIVIKKYGSLSQLENMLHSKHENKKLLREKRDTVKSERENKIKKLFFDNKLEFKNVGDVYLYINYGKLNPEDIVNNEICKINKKSFRRIELANKLQMKNIKLDETNLSCYKYINGMTDSLDDTVLDMINKTNENTQYFAQI